MTPNEIVDVVKTKCAGDPVFHESLKHAFDRVLDKIGDRAKARRPVARVFEVHHENEVARLALFTAIAEGRSIEKAENEALARVGL